MSTPFTRSLRSLRADSARRSVWAVLLGAVVAGTWGVWAVASEVPVYEQSPQAKLEVAGGVHAVQAPAPGAIVTIELSLGARVEEGDLLVVLDTSEHEKALAEKRAELIALEEQLEALDALRQAELGAVAAAEQAKSAAVGEAKAKALAAEPKKALAAERAKRLAELREQQEIFSEAELDEAKAEAASLERSMAALEKAVGSLRADHRFRISDRRVRLSELARDAANLRASMKTVVPAIERLAVEIDKRRIRAPRSGVLGTVTELRKGGFVAAGDPLFTIIPDGELRAVASYPAWRALGRIQPGQSAQLRMHGFPWTQYGSIHGEVTSIGNEAQDGLIRVELSIAREKTPIPLQHGLTTTVEIEVERVSPATLLLRAAGKLLEPEPDPVTPKPEPEAPSGVAG